MMDKVVAEVKESVEREYGRAGAKYGLTNHSDHESYAVLLEEVQEAEEELAHLGKDVYEFWYGVKNDVNDYDKYIQCRKIEKRAIMAACELIQVAAMAKKAAVTICDRGAVNELRGVVQE